MQLAIEIYNHWKQQVKEALSVLKTWEAHTWVLFSVGALAWGGRRLSACTHSILGRYSETLNDTVASSVRRIRSSEVKNVATQWSYIHRPGHNADLGKPSSWDNWDKTICQNYPFSSYEQNYNMTHSPSATLATQSACTSFPSLTTDGQPFVLPLPFDLGVDHRYLKWFLHAC